MLKFIRVSKGLLSSIENCMLMGMNGMHRGKLYLKFFFCRYIRANTILKNPEISVFSAKKTLKTFLSAHPSDPVVHESIPLLNEIGNFGHCIHGMTPAKSK